MKQQPPIKRLPDDGRPVPRKGFALVATLSLMILLTLIAVGLLSLSSISLRSSTGSLAMAEARSNARLAVQLAIGQLQLTTGQDTRVTASANLIDVANPQVTGAWRSWEGADHDATGKPVIPNYNSKKAAGNPNDQPGAPASGRFLGWLTSSGANALSPDIALIPDVSKTIAPGHVPIVSTGSASNPAHHVHMKPVPLNASGGSFAWWISGENSKAMINTDRIAKPSTTAQWQQQVRSNGKADAKSFGLENVNTYPAGKLIPSTGNLKLASPTADLKKIHDLTAYNRGLLTNTATGGWRKDLSQMSERYTEYPSSNLPFFTLTPGKDQKFSKAQLNSTSGSPLIYPWAKYRNNATGAPWQQVPPICSWSALVDYARQYKNLPSTGNASKTSMNPTFAFGNYGDPNQRLEFQDKVRRVPQLARIQWIYSIGSRRVPGSAPPKYNPGILVTPVLTLWNPYNVEVKINSFSVNIQEIAPLLFRLKLAGATLPDVSLNDVAKGGTDYTRFHIKIDTPITLAPGASKIFSTTDRIPTVNTATTDVKLKPGYTAGGGVLFTFIKKTANGMVEVAANATDSFEVEKISYNALTYEEGKGGIGIIFDIYINGQSASPARMIYDVNDLGGQTVLSQLYPPLTRKINAAVSSIEVTTAAVGSIPSQPFASALFGYRMASPLSRDPKHKHLFSKGMLQANPLCMYTEIGFGDDASAVNTMAGTGVYHPINAPYDFAFQDMEGWNDTLVAPQWEGAATGSSYIVSGLTAGDGLTRCVIAELPTRPLQSLAELQHFDARNNNVIPPFQFNLIGNGSAHPIFAPDRTSVDIPASHKNQGMCNDDTYILNHLLFDDWFFSSITPEIKEFGSGTIRQVRDVYRDHLSLTKPLPNRFYLPAPGAASPDPTAAAATALTNIKDSQTGKYQFETIASKLEVDGMFNINSVSLEAWKAVLRQSRDLQVPYLSPNGSTSSGNASSFAYPRTSIAGDQGSDSASKASNATFPEAAEFAGYRVFTDAQIDALAEEIVSEIRKRGPFLSLGEFVNRQLTTNKDLAIASTIQKALDNLANMGASPKNPFAAIQSVATQITTIPPGKTDYKFPEAALGSSAFGVPGWVRQADILKPLAPVISARDDTFTIRTYGDARERGNSGKILARAWCEVVVRRNADFVDTLDPAAVTPHSTQMKSAINKRFGRRYGIVSFRWLSDAEI